MTAPAAGPAPSGRTGVRRMPVRPVRPSRPERLRIAMLAPPWISVPPRGYGGMERVVADLAGGLVRRGHEVSLLAAPGSRSEAEVVTLLERDHPQEIGRTVLDVDHVARAMAVVDEAAWRGRPFQVVHDHSGFAVVAFADRIDAPVLHTVHGPFDQEARAFYRRHGRKVWLACLSDAQAESAPVGLRHVGTIPNPIDLRAWPLEPRKQPYLLWMGRMDAGKGAHRAIAAARLAGLPLVLAGPVQAGQEEHFETEVRPHIDGVRVRYVAEVGGRRKRELFAHATALLMPIRWPEPFGMVMVEAMACGTPVIAFRTGSAPEVVQHGRSGFLVDDEEAMARAVHRVADLDPEQVRASVRERRRREAGEQQPAWSVGIQRGDRPEGGCERDAHPGDLAHRVQGTVRRRRASLPVTRGHQRAELRSPTADVRSLLALVPTRTDPHGGPVRQRPPRPVLTPR